MIRNLLDWLKGCAQKVWGALTGPRASAIASKTLRITVSVALAYVAWLALKASFWMIVGGFVPSVGLLVGLAGFLLAGLILTFFVLSTVGSLAWWAMAPA